MLLDRPNPNATADPGQQLAKSPVTRRRRPQVLAAAPRADSPYPFSALVGQDEMKQAILIAAVDPAIGGVLVLGDRGTGKSTAVRGLAALLPKMSAVRGCAYHCDPAAHRRCRPSCCRFL